ncbi:hypothetical protein J21TS7_38700 [Paenibacillus cineris]|uniref:Uncharacterized protein n=1 Tax=Paenibacillus cineris TaxID=237530 RepID=A0ABQ4LG84_9BACL|nr:hypothetical protein J21TS7_38700 [Paenibacillus cineris]
MPVRIPLNPPYPKEDSRGFYPLDTRKPLRTDLVWSFDATVGEVPGSSPAAPL